MVGEKKIYERDVGVRFIVTVALPSNPTAEKLSRATLIKLYVKKPSGTEVVWNPYKSDANGTLDNTDSATALSYVTVEGDLNEAGTYKLHAYVEWLDGSSKHHGQVATFKVSKKFDTST